MGQLLSQPCSSTNQFLIENVSPVIKEKWQNTLDQRRNNKKTGKSMPMYRGAGWATWEVEDIRDKTGTKKILQKSDKHMKRRASEILSK